MARNQPPRKVLLRSPPHVMSCDRRPRKGKEVAERGKKGGISCVCVWAGVLMEDGRWFSNIFPLSVAQERFAKAFFQNCVLLPGV